MPSQLFTPTVEPSKLDSAFESIRSALPDHPGRAMIEDVYADFTDPDGNFREQFQTTGFNPRFFELYLFALLSREGYTLDRTHPNPDFIVERDGCRVALEATTVNPASSGPLSESRKKIADLSGAELDEYIRHELAIRFGSPLFSKLKKKYWELGHCEKLPLVIAIQAFHDEHSHIFTDNALSRYLYGLDQRGDWLANGRLNIDTHTVKEHVVGKKVIPSNFFAQEGAEHISAVVFTNSGTLGKFDRMGFQHGYGNSSWTMMRFGFSFDSHPDAMDPVLFEYDVGHPPVVETWSQGLVVNHNPNAIIPLPRSFFPDVLQAYVEDGALATDHTGWHPFSSKTVVTHLGDLKKKMPPWMSFPTTTVAAMTKFEFQQICSYSQDKNPLWDEDGWFSDESQSFLGVLVCDKIESEWKCVILARDSKFKFWPIEEKSRFSSRSQARETIQLRIRELLHEPKRIFVRDNR